MTCIALTGKIPEEAYNDNTRGYFLPSREATRVTLSA